MNLSLARARSGKLSKRDLANASLALQLCYPQIWFACHGDHQTRTSAKGLGLTDREHGILAHIAEPELAANMTALAQHLGIGKPALSVHLSRLQRLGLISWQASVADKRRKQLQLTAPGIAELQRRGPLDTLRVEALLMQLSPLECTQAIAGLQLLALAARRIRLPAESQVARSGVESAESAEALVQRDPSNKKAKGRRL